MKNVFSYLIIAQILCAPAVHARDTLSIVNQVVHETSPRAFESLQGLNLTSEQTDKAVAKMSRSLPAQFSAHVGQTFLFIMAVAGIDLVYQQIQQSGKSPESFNAAQMTAMFVAAAEHILNDGSLYFAMIGAESSDVALKYPIELLRAAIANPGTHVILVDALSSSMRSSAKFWGWDFFAQLWKEGTLQLNAEESLRLKSLGWVGVGALSGVLFGKHENLKDLDLVKKMAHNVLNVALFDQDLRATWLSTTFRTRIMTGEFSTLLASVMAASGIGTLICPGAGSVAGLIFGISGAAISLFIPQYIKDEVTGELQSARARTDQLFLKKNNLELKQEVTELPPFNLISSPTRVRRLQSEFKSRHRIRSRWLTISFERLRLNLRQSIQTPTQAIVDILEERRQTSLFLDQEAKWLSSLQAHCHPEAPFEFNAILSDEVRRWAGIAKFMNDVSLGLEQDVRSRADLESSAYLNFVEISYSRGFSEETVEERSR